METRSNINGLLRFYLEAGVDETIGLSTINRLTIKATGPEQRTAPEQPPQHRNSRPLRQKASAPLPSPSDEILQARKLATSCQTIEDLHEAVKNFDGSILKRMAMSTVFAEGSPDSKLMIIDRQPSVEEDRSGKPFAGRPGDLLEKMLASIGLGREDVYLAGFLPWRPPGGRAPTDEELSLCIPFIERHIFLANPEFVLACGEAAGYLMKRKTGINKLRGTWFDLSIQDACFKMLPVFHPTFLLDHPAAKKYAWMDFLRLKSAMKG